MKKILPSFLIWLTVLFFFSCVEPKISDDEVSGDTVLFFDDFLGDKLDTSKWNVLITGQVFNAENQAYIDSSLTIYTVDGENAEGAENGALVIHPRFAEDFQTADGQNFDFLSGRIHTLEKFSFTYGKAEAKLKITEGTGLWPAWWLLGNGGWPETGEIDIMEYVGQNEWTNAAIHGPGYSGNTPFVRRDSFAMKDPVSNWHVYAVDWTPDSLTFSIDGRDYYTVTREMVEARGKWAFDIPKHLILNFAVGGGYPADVNGIKSPYLGLPQESVDLIKEGKAKLLIDWVRVTRGRKGSLNNN